jgi:hypothetical protein
MHQLTFNLIQKAKNKGGDKYVCETIPEFIIYIPQTISRLQDGTVQQKLNLVIS